MKQKSINYITTGSKKLDATFILFNKKQYNAKLKFSKRRNIERTSQNG